MRKYNVIMRNTVNPVFASTAIAYAVSLTRAVQIIRDNVEVDIDAFASGASPYAYDIIEVKA